MIGHSSIVNLDLKISSREIADSLAVHNESSVGAETAVEVIETFTARSLHPYLSSCSTSVLPCSLSILPFVQYHTKLIPQVIAGNDSVGLDRFAPAALC